MGRGHATTDDVLQSGGVPSGVGPRALDPELVALPAPPQGRRLATLLVMAAAVVAALGLALSLRLDMVYTLADRQPTPLGNVRDLTLEQVPLNTYVTLAGTPTLSRAVRFSRSLAGDYRLFPLAGQRLVFVQVADRPEAMARAQFTGRVVRFGDLGSRYAPVVQHLSEVAEQPVTPDSLVLLADEAPGDYYWTWMIALLCVGFIGLDTFFIVRWFRPLPWAAEALEGLRQPRE